MTRALTWRLPRADLAKGEATSAMRQGHSLPPLTGRRIAVRALIGLHEALLGRRTLSLARQLEQTQWLPERALRAMQLEKLRALISHASTHCPYYRALSLPMVDCFRTVNDLLHVPLLTRAELRRNAAEMRWARMPGRFLTDHTHGTSDESFAFYCDRSRQAWDKALRLRGHRWHGFEPGDRELHLWPIDPPRNRSARLRQWLRHRRDALVAEMQIDSLQVTKEDVREFWRRWAEFAPTRVTAYPSALAEMILEGHRLGCQMASTSVRRIFLTGEVTFDWQRRLIEDLLQAEVTESYGLQEAGAIAFCCEAGSWHTSDEAFVVEILRDGHPAASGEWGELVVTCLESRAMPLVRYCTGDIVRAQHLGGCDCGRGLARIPPIVGRSSDFLESADGRWIPPAEVVATLGAVLDDGAWQLRQTDEGDVTLDVIADGRHHRVAREQARLLLQRLLGRGMACTVRPVSALRRTSFGKRRYIESLRTRRGLALPREIDDGSERCPTARNPT